MMCSNDSSGDSKDGFMASTRKHHLACLTYQASIHLAYESETNHERITPSSFARLQATREDLQRLASQQIDPGSDIVVLICDMVTDQRHFHFVKSSKAADSSSALQAQVLLACPTHLLRTVCVRALGWLLCYVLR